MKTAYKVLRVFLVFALVLPCGESAAQSYPNKPIKLVVGYAPGGSTDILARIISPTLAERLGQPVVVENRPGAESIVAAEYMTKTAPDGYTIFVGGSAMVFNSGLYTRLPYDPVRDFIPITMVISGSLVFAVHPSVPATSIKELIVLAKAKPGDLFYAAGAPVMRVAAELFKKQAGVNVVHVPYKGTGPAVTAAVAGEVQLVVLTIAPPVLAQLRAGKLRALAVTGLERSTFLPDIPTVSESGLDFEGGLTMWVGLFAPAGTPGAIIDKFYSELSVMLKSESLKEHFASLGYETSETGLSPAQFGAFYRASLAKWPKMTRDLNISAD
jgi:tripartite-type tricarboxylate transporter receptor subunit TctC